MKPKCRDTRPCFARKEGRCICLNETYPEGKCPFCKPEMEVTNGVFYPFIPRGEEKEDDE